MPILILKTRTHNSTRSNPCFLLDPFKSNPQNSDTDVFFQMTTNLSQVKQNSALQDSSSKYRELISFSKDLNERRCNHLRLKDKLHRTLSTKLPKKAIPQTLTPKYPKKPIFYRKNDPKNDSKNTGENPNKSIIPHKNPKNIFH
jgi:hypothetical protein